MSAVHRRTGTTSAKDGGGITTREQTQRTASALSVALAAALVASGGVTGLVLIDSEGESTPSAAPVNSTSPAAPAPSSTPSEPPSDDPIGSFLLAGAPPEPGRSAATPTGRSGASSGTVQAGPLGRQSKGRSVGLTVATSTTPWTSSSARRAGAGAGDNGGGSIEIVGSDGSGSGGSGGSGGSTGGSGSPGTDNSPGTGGGSGTGGTGGGSGTGGTGGSGTDGGGSGTGSAGGDSSGTGDGTGGGTGGTGGAGETGGGTGGSGNGGGIDLPDPIDSVLPDLPLP